MKVEYREKIALYSLLCLAFCGVAFLYASWLLTRSSEVAFLAVFGALWGLFMLTYGVLKFKSCNRTLLSRSRALSKGIELEVKVISKGFSSLGNRPFWQVTAEGQIAGENCIFIDRFLLCDPGESFSVGSQVKIKYVKGCPDEFIFLMNPNER